MVTSPTFSNGYFSKYTSLVPTNEIKLAFEQQEHHLQNFYESVTEQKSMYAYAEGKWTLKEMLQHMIDTERIFSYRALVIARKDATALAGFDENEYAANSNANNRTWQSLQNEMKIVRASTIALYQSFNDETLQNSGFFSGNEGSVHTLGLIMAGHIYHHISVAEERYFK